MFSKLLKTGLVLAALVLFAAPSSALTSLYADDLGLGDLGYVAPGGSLDAQHFFAPATDSSIVISSIDSAWLSITVVDDWNCSRLRACFRDWLFESEFASIDLNSVSWRSGSATTTRFLGDVSAEADLLNNGGLLDLSITSNYGDFVVLKSTLTTVYTYDVAGVGTAGGGGGAGVSPMPEPSAALVFAIGALVVQRRLRRGIGSR